MASKINYSFSLPDLFLPPLSQEQAVSSHSVEWHSTEFAGPKRVYSTSSSSEENGCSRRRLYSRVCSQGLLHASEWLLQSLAERFQQEGHRCSSLVGRGASLNQMSNDPLEDKEFEFTYFSDMLLGHGTFGAVFAGEDLRTDSPVAVKVLVLKDALCELGIHNAMEEQRVPHSLYARGVIPTDPGEPLGINIVTDLVPYSNIYKQYLDPRASCQLLSFHDMVTIGKQCLEFLSRLGALGIVHRDIKPDNMIFEAASRHLVVLDYGLSIKTTELSIDEAAGTFSYEAPELLLARVADSSIDTWSLGATLFELFTDAPLIPEITNATGRELNNCLLQIMAHRIGMPSLSFLQNCRDSSLYFNLCPQVKFNNPQPMLCAPWREAIFAAGVRKKVSPESVLQLAQLLEGMLLYEGRMAPADLLKLPIFSHDVSFSLSSENPPQDDMIFFDATEVEAYLQNPSLTPLPAPLLILENVIRVHRRCLHLPATRDHRYLVFFHQPNGSLHTELTFDVLQRNHRFQREITITNGAHVTMGPDDDFSPTAAAAAIAAAVGPLPSYH